LLVGVYGRRNSNHNIGSISFVVFEEDNGRVEVKGKIYNICIDDFELTGFAYCSGPFGAPPQTGTAFGTFGHVVAFAGTQESACMWKPSLLHLLTYLLLLSSWPVCFIHDQD
jgi:hypothetical protein